MSTKSEMIFNQQSTTMDDLGPIEARESGEVYTNRVYWIVFWANLGLALFKLTMGALGYSRLLIIDGLNSAANVVVITTVFFGIRMSRPQTVNERYPYGKGKAEFMVTLVVGFLLAVGASAILALSIKTFFLPISLEPTGIGMATALISIGGNLILIRFLKQAGLLQENVEFQKMAHLQSLNIASSAVVIQSLLLAGLFGWFVAERIGGVSISLIVVWLSIRIIKSSLDGIMDRSSGKKIESRITALAGAVDKVEKVEWVRTRRVGQNLCIDLNVGLNGDCTIRQADQVAARIRERLCLKMERISHVTVHRYPV
ncbi:MAG: cation transporter [Deltaproteobacteria bacterium]|nr:cation transporter [Deltaproteobacteria bacterium]